MQLKSITWSHCFRFLLSVRSWAWLYVQVGSPATGGKKTKQNSNTEIMHKVK